MRTCVINKYIKRKKQLVGIMKYYITVKANLKIELWCILYNDAKNVDLLWINCPKLPENKFLGL